MKKHLKKYNIIFKNSKVNEIKNSNWPKRYRSEFIEPGICSYADIGAGIIFIGTDTLDKMNPTFIGKPVVNEIHQDMTASEAFKLSNEDLESMADGVVYEAGKLSNGWYYCDMIIWDEETQKNIDNGYSVSCAYIVDEVGPGGKYHEIPYDEEVLNGTYTHNCITNSPRYEGAKVYELSSDYQNKRADEICNIYKNCKGEDMKIFKSNIFKHLLNSSDTTDSKCGGGKKKNQTDDTPPDKKPDDEMQNMEGAMIEVDGEKIPLEDAVNAYKSAMSNQDGGDQGQTLNPEDTVEIDGNPVKVGDLIAAYKANRQNAEPPQDVVAEPVIEDQKTMSNQKPKEKKNFFKIVKNAAKETEEVKVYVNTIDERLKRGKSKYGSKKEVS